jgi:hypothetical protein
MARALETGRASAIGTYNLGDEQVRRTNEATARAAARPFLWIVSGDERAG